MTPNQINERITSKSIRHFVAVGVDHIASGIDGFDAYWGGRRIAEFRTKIVGCRVDISVMMVRDSAIVSRTAALTEEWHHDTPEGYCDKLAFELFGDCIGSLVSGATYHDSGMIKLQDGTLCSGLSEAFERSC